MATRPTINTFTSNARIPTSELNANFTALADAIEGVLGRGGTDESPNSMTGTLDMDLNPIQNLPAPVNSKDATNKAYVDGLLNVTVLPGTTVVSTSKSSGTAIDWDAVNSNTIAAVVETYTELQNVSPFIDGDGIVVLGRIARGDGGGGTFYWDSSDLSSEVTIDTQKGIYVPPTSDTTGASGAWVRVYDYLLPEMFGAKGDGVTDDYAAFSGMLAIQNRKVQLTPGADYAIGTTIVIGNGSSSAPSSYNGLSMIGMSQGASGAEIVSGEGTPIKFTWIGAAGGTMVDIEGPIYGLHLEGFSLDCAGLANTAILFNHPTNSNFKDLLALNYKGNAYDLRAYDDPVDVVVGASNNIFANVNAKRPAVGGSGFSIGAVFSSPTGKVLDVARNIFIGCQWFRDGTTGTTASLILQFCDNNTFIECHTTAEGGTSGDGISIAPPSGLTQFPLETAFYNCPIQGGVSVGATWTTTQGIVFFPYPTSDAEPTPSPPIDGQIYGILSTGEWFGGFKVSPGSNAITKHLTSTQAMTWGSIASQGSSSQNLSVTGAVVGDTVTVNSGVALIPAGGILQAFVSVADVVTVSWTNASASPITPGSSNYTVEVWGH